MPLFQAPPRTAEEIARGKPLEIPPEQVMTMDEREWYARVYRGDDVPQLTVRAVVTGCALGFLLAFTNLYVGLKTGWYLAVAITACILSHSIWSTLLRVGVARTPMSILENNCMQSCASCAGYGTGSTIISAIPAMLLLTTSAADPRGHNLPWWIVAPWTLVLALLGVSLAIPMKRNLINRERLRFPQGTAAAMTLHSLLSEGEEALRKARALYGAAIVGALTPVLTGLNVVKKVGAHGAPARGPLVPGTVAAFDWLPRVHGFALSRWTLRLDVSFLLIGAGAIVGLRTSASMMLGTLLTVVIIGPRALDASWTNTLGDVVTAVTAPEAAWKQIGLWCGAPLMVSYGLVGFALQGPMIARAFRRLGGAADPADADDVLTARVEVPRSWFLAGASVASVGAIALSRLYFGIPVPMAILAVGMSFFLTLVAARATGETSVTPVGPLGKIVQLTYGVLMPQNGVANLMTAGISANAANACADLLNDLKVGYLLGANPRRQVIAQLFGVGVGTVATTLGYFVLVPDATVLTGSDGAPPRFPAPSAQQWKAVADVFRLGIANLHPMAQAAIGWGLAIGIALALIEKAWPAGKAWLPSATAVGLGLMLPSSIPVAFLIGALLASGAARANKPLADRYVVPLASGVIAGESILGVVVAALNNFVF